MTAPSHSLPRIPLSPISPPPKVATVAPEALLAGTTRPGMGVHLVPGGTQTPAHLQAPGHMLGQDHQKSQRSRLLWAQGARWGVTNLWSHE